MTTTRFRLCDRPKRGEARIVCTIEGDSWFEDRFEINGRLYARRIRKAAPRRPLWRVEVPEVACPESVDGSPRDAVGQELFEFLRAEDDG